MNNNNNTEAEIKVEVDEETFERCRQMLPYSGLRRPDFGKPERNIFYRTPEGFLRLRNDNGEVFVTYKGEREESETVNVREEIEFDHTERDFQKLQTFFSRLGLEKYFEYEKQRIIYRYDAGLYGRNDLAVSLDILPNGQRYIEIEETAADGLYDPQDHGNTLKNMVRFLGLENHSLEKRNYLEILMEERGKNDKH